MRVDVLTIFPDLVEHYASRALLGRARRSGLLDLRVHDLRSAATDPHRSVDDTPFGGGVGMVLSAAPILATVDAVAPVRPLLALGPGGWRFDQAVARAFAAALTGRPVERPGPHGDWLFDLAQAVGSSGGLSLLCGRYEGVDERVLEHVVDGELSVGDVVLAGGELPALVVIEAVTRLLPGALGNAASADDESFSDGLLEYPQYTRPAELRGWAVPPVLRSGDHGRIRRWRTAMALRRTVERRPDLIAARGGLSASEVELMARADELAAWTPTATVLDGAAGGAPAPAAAATDPSSPTSTAAAGVAAVRGPDAAAGRERGEQGGGGSAQASGPAPAASPGRGGERPPSDPEPGR